MSPTLPAPKHDMNTILTPGTSVRTTQADTTVTDWEPTARAHCRWGVLGTIRSHSDSHGLCYQIVHPDGTTAWYAPTEFIEQPTS